MSVCLRLVVIQSACHRNTILKGTPMIRKMLILPALAAALVLNPISSTPAAADSDDVAKLLLGAVAVGAIVHVVKKERERDAARAAAARATATANEYNLPTTCTFQIRTHKGRQDVLGQRCMQQEGVNISRLPTYCSTTINSHRGPRTVYDERCLREFGYVIQTKHS